MADDHTRKYFFTVLVFILVIFPLPPCRSAIEAKTENTLTELLTPAENAWIKNHPVVRVSGPKAFPPFSFFNDKGASYGMAYDYLKLIIGDLGIKIEVQGPMKWEDVLNKTQAHEIDLISCAALTRDREDYLIFSDPYLSFPLVIISRKNASFIGGLEDLRGLKVVFIKRVSTYQWLKEDNVAVKELFADSPIDALKMVSIGRADAYIENLAAASYMIEKYGLANLKIAAPTNYDSYNLHFAVRKDWPELVSIINKGLGSLSMDKHREIRNRWLSVRYEYGIRPVDVWKWVLVVAVPAFIILALVVFWNRRLQREITQRILAEDERGKLQIQLNQAQKMDSIGRLAGGVAHDFNNMLGVIIGHAEMAVLQLEPSNPIQHRLAQIRNAAKRSANLTQQLLAYARRQPISPKVLDLNETLESMLNMLKSLIGENIDIVWLPGKGLWQVKVDPSQIDQILANLCVNARDSISGVGKVTIETENIVFDKDYCDQHTGFTPGSYVMLSVSDNG
ncbi:MAG: transporter substrate-binding domain-containing protein, partial [Desulfamplus sp.]|nr:transporter substrate-binding domain-containing protein [Desulfamplus sp.]